MTQARSFSCNAPLWNRFPRQEILVATVKKQLLHGQNRSGRRKKSFKMTGVAIHRRRRNTIEDGRQNRCAVTTNHLFWPNERRKRGFLLSIRLPIRRFPAGKCNALNREGGGGGRPRAAAQSAITDKLSRNFILNASPALSLLWKKCAAPWRQNCCADQGIL